MIDEKPSFEHHGVKGMHWGVRTRTQSSYGEAKAREKERVASLKPSRVISRKISEVTGDPRSAVTFASVAAVGVAFTQSPQAKAAMKISMSNVGKAAGNRNVQRITFKALKGAGKLYMKTR